MFYFSSKDLINVFVELQPFLLSSNLTAILIPQLPGLKLFPKAVDDFPSALIKLEGREKCRPPSVPILFCVNLTAKQDWLDPPHSLFYFVPRERDWYGGYPGDGKSRRINFSLWRCVPMAQYAPKLVFTHAKEPVELVRTLFLWYTAFHISLWQISSGFGNHCHCNSLTEKY